MKRFMKSAMACAVAAAMVFTAVPATTVSAAAKTVTVSSQKELNKALKSGATKIVIKTSKKIKLTIPSGKYTKTSVVINAKNASVTNKGRFKGVTLQDAAVCVEKASGNTFKVTDKNARFAITKSAKGTRVTVSAKDGNVKIAANGDVKAISVAEAGLVKLTGTTTSVPTVSAKADGARIYTTVKADIKATKAATISLAGAADGSDIAAAGAVTINVAKSVAAGEININGTDAAIKLNINGTVAAIKVNAKADVAIAGSTDSVAVVVNAKDAAVSSAVKTEVTLNATAEIKLEKGAEDSKVVLGNTDAVAKVENATDIKVAVVDAAGKETVVETGKEASVATPTTPSTDGNSGTTGGTSGGTTTTTPSFVEPTAIKLSTANTGCTPEVTGTTVTAVVEKTASNGAKGTVTATFTNATCKNGMITLTKDSAVSTEYSLSNGVSNTKNTTWAELSGAIKTGFEAIKNGGSAKVTVNGNKEVNVKYVSSTLAEISWTTGIYTVNGTISLSGSTYTLTFTGITLA